MHEFRYEFSRESAGSLFPCASSAQRLSRSEVAAFLKSIELTLNNPEFVVNEELVARFFNSISLGNQTVSLEDVYYPLKALAEQLSRK